MYGSKTKGVCVCVCVFVFMCVVAHCHQLFGMAVRVYRCIFC